MRKAVLFIILIFIGSSVFAQQESIIFNDLHYSIDDSTKFLMYIDTMEKYMYRDVKIVEQAIVEAEAIRAKNSTLSNSHLLAFATEKVYYTLNKDDLLLSYKIIKESESLLDDETVSDMLKGRFIYINAFTHMEIGDIPTAQKIYYNLSQSSIEKKDTTLMVSALYSLGQLYADEQDYLSAKKIYLDLFEIMKVHKERPSTVALISLELSEVYTNLDELDKALEIIENGLTLLENEKIERLKADFLLLKGEVALEQNDLVTANKIYQELVPLVYNNKDPMNEFNLSFFHARILSHQNKYQSALRIYDELIAEQDSSTLDRKKSLLNKAHEVAFNMGNPSLAYQYAVQQNDINEKIQEEKKQQETAYLKIKFESEEKERENQQLALDILEEQNQNRLLYLTTCLFLLGLFILFIAFFQKKKFSQTLQEEVKKRTQDLETSIAQLDKTNKELFQFSHICSHDLKEPIITIKNFLGLIEKENTSNDNSQYFQYINQNMTRLSNLLEQIRIYFDANDDTKLAIEKISVKEIHQNVSEDLSEMIEIKNAIVILENQLPSDYIFCSKLGLELTLKILTENALRFNNSQQPKVDIRFGQLNNQLSITIEDNGIGIDEKFFDYVFEPFKTIGSRHTHNSAGLGLAICKKIVVALGGKITITSEVNKGSTFHILFKNEKKDNMVYACKKSDLVLVEN